MNFLSIDKKDGTHLKLIPFDKIKSIGIDENVIAIHVTDHSEGVAIDRAANDVNLRMVDISDLGEFLQQYQSIKT